MPSKVKFSREPDFFLNGRFFRQTGQKGLPRVSNTDLADQLGLSAGVTPPTRTLRILNKKRSLLPPGILNI
jgi:hypothetical protein